MCIVNEKKEIIFKAFLKDKTFAVFHLIGPECKNCVSKGLKKLSYSTILNRFNSPLKKLSDNQLEYLTSTDNNNHLAIGAGLCHISNNPGMGIARYIRIDNKSAEIAITIIDEYQNKGLGTLLLSLLIKYGLNNKIKNFIGYINNNNISMIKIFNKFNSKKINYENNMIIMELNLLKSKKKVLEIINNTRDGLWDMKI